MLVLENFEESDWQLECGQLRQRGARLLASAQWADCSFLLGRERAPQKAHRLLLAMASPVFQAMFYGPLAERDAPLSLPDIQPEVFLLLLQYIYTDQISLDSDILAIELYYAAQKYMLRRLQRLCTTYLHRNLSPQNACRIYEFAYLIGDRKLEYKSLKVIKAETKLALSDSSFERLSLATVISIFSMDDLTIDSELDLFSAAERYYLAQQENLDEKSTSSTPLPDVQPENDPQVIPDGNTNGVSENHNEEKSILHDDNRSINNEEDKESARNRETLSSSELPLACEDIEKEDDRARSEATTFRFTVQNFKCLENDVMSPPCYVRELPWQISVCPYIDDKGQKHLAVFLYCNYESKSSSWSCEANFQLRLLKDKAGSVPFIHLSKLLYLKYQTLFSSTAKGWGFNTFMPWDDVVDPSKGYIKDDSITVEAHVIAEEPDGIPLSLKKLAEMKDLSMKKLIKQIRFLTLTTAQLADYKPRSCLLTEHDFFALMMNISSKTTYLPLPKMFSRCRVGRTPQNKKKIKK